MRMSETTDIGDRDGSETSGTEEQGETLTMSDDKNVQLVDAAEYPDGCDVPAVRMWLQPLPLWLLLRKNSML